jgi:MFS family permease
MTSSSPGRQLSVQSKDDRKVAVATLAGTTIEWYDFFIYSNAAALVLTQQFFSPFAESHGEVAGRILAFATVGVSFVVRPLGAMVAGHLGDRIGRKAMLVVTLLVMGIATTAIGLLPTYDQVGMAAPVALVALRVLQGFSAGGEWGGAALMAVEHAPDKKRGLFGGFPQVGVPFGMFLATIVLMIVTGFTTDAQFDAWGWRVPFILSLLLVIGGLIIRLSVTESPVFKEMMNTEGQVKMPLVSMLRYSPGPLVKASLIFMGHSAAGYMITGGYILSYTTSVRGMNRDTMLQVVAVAAAVFVATTILGAALSDKWGRTKTFKIGFGLLVVWYFPLFWLLGESSPGIILAGMLVLVVGLGLTYGPLSALFAEMFPARIRYSGAGMGYALGSILGGAFSPMIATWLQDRFGTTMAVAAYLLVLTGIALITMFFVKDCTGVSLRVGSMEIPGSEKLEAALVGQLPAAAGVGVGTVGESGGSPDRVASKG